MQTLNGYTLDEKQWKTKGGGGQCNVATKNGKKYFIKKLSSPKYPVSAHFTEELKRIKIAECNEWIKQRNLIIKTLPGDGTGTFVKPIEYFREGPCFYEVAHFVDDSGIPYEEIWQKSTEDKCRIMLTVAMSVADMHKVNVVHGDLDPGNILISRASASGNLMTKLIDFSDSFFGDNPPKSIMSKEFWWSPEVAMYSKVGDSAENPYKKLVSCKADVFSLGIIFHQYCAKNAEPPKCEKAYPWQDVLNGNAPRIDSNIEPDFQELIASMLELEPSNRPSIFEVHKKLQVIYRMIKDGKYDRETEPVIYTVTLDPNGGSVNPTSFSVTYNDIYSNLPTPTRTGYDFNGWYTVSSGGTQVTANTKVTTAKDHTIYAQWTKQGSGKYKPGSGKNENGHYVTAVEETRNPNKVKVFFSNGKEQILDLKLAIGLGYVEVNAK